MPDLSNPVHCSRREKQTFLVAIGALRVKKLMQFHVLINYYELTMPCCIENGVNSNQLASEETH